MQLKDIMTSHVAVVHPTTTVQQAPVKMRELEIGPLPVCEGDRLVGMLTDRDITIRAVAEGRDLTQMPVREVMTPEVVYCFEDQEETAATTLMEKHQIRRLPILNREQRLVGWSLWGISLLRPVAPSGWAEPSKRCRSPRSRAANSQSTKINFTSHRRNSYAESRA
jgi:predicted transcriptional regulator